MSNVLDLPTNGDAILDDTRDFIDRFCAFPDEHCLNAVTLWCALAHMGHDFDTSPRLAMLSPEPGSGKTRVLEILENLTPQPMFVFGASTAALFRAMAENEVTLLFDEVDTIFTRRGSDDQNEDLRALLNVGYRNGATIPRCVGPQHEVKYFNVFASVALAGLGDLPETLMSRSIVVRMRRRAPHEHVEPYRPRQHADEGNAIRERLEEWSTRVGPKAGKAWPELPEGIVDRLAEVWEPVVSVADVAGGQWPERARQAAIAFVDTASDRAPSLGIRLLTDLKEVFGSNAVMSTDSILEALNGMDEAPWGNLRGHPLDARGLANRLRPYDVHPTVVRIGDSTPRGYRAEDLFDAWQRYLPPSTPPQSATSATSATKAPDSPATGANVADVADVADSDTGEGEWSMVSKLLDELRAAGFTVTTNGSEINVAGPPENMTPEFRRRIAANKDGLIALVADTMPAPEVLLKLCRDAVTGTNVDPVELRDWLLEQDDPGWCVPRAVRRWAELIHGRGGFPHD